MAVRSTVRYVHGRRVSYEMRHFAEPVGNAWVDSGIAPLVRVLQSAGVQTFSSCQESFDGRAFVAFYGPMPSWLEPWACEKYNRAYGPLGWWVIRLHPSEIPEVTRQVETIHRSP